MIIKKKYTTIKKITENTSDSEKEKSENIEVFDNIQENNSHIPKNNEENEIDEITKQTPSFKEEKKDEKKKKDIKDLDLSIENIKFEQREERREGTRRRGYRRTQDRNVVTRAQKDAQSIKEAAKQEGYQEGINAAQKDLQDLKSNFAEFFNYKDEVYKKVAECIMDISVEMARKIINKEIETNRDYIIPLIKNVIEEIHKTENKITLKVMPKDVEILKDKISDIFSDNYFEAKISVIPDNNIKDGGVIVETSNGIIDATIETQLAIIEKALKKQEESQV